MVAIKKTANNKNQKIIKLNINPNLYSSLILFGILILTALIYSQTIKFSFIEWDDFTTIVGNQYIKDISLSNFFYLFNREHFTVLSLLTHAIEYKIWGLNPMPYHINNLVIHLINILLVYNFIKLISGRKDIPIIAAILFAVHPLRVESVAWVVERKDLLFTLWALLGMIAYIKYIKSKKIKYLILSFITLYLSSLSKIQILTIPFALFLFDYFYSRRFSIKVIFEKFLLIGLIFPNLIIIYIYNNIILLLFSFPSNILNIIPWFLNYIYHTCLIINLYNIHFCTEIYSFLLQYNLLEFPAFQQFLNLNILEWIIPIIGIIASSLIIILLKKYKKHTSFYILRFLLVFIILIGNNFFATEELFVIMFFLLMYNSQLKLLNKTNKFNYIEYIILYIIILFYSGIFIYPQYSENFNNIQNISNLLISIAILLLIATCPLIIKLFIKNKSVIPDFHFNYVIILYFILMGQGFYIPSLYIAIALAIFYIISLAINYFISIKKIDNIYIIYYLSFIFVFIVPFYFNEYILFPILFLYGADFYNYKKINKDFKINNFVYFLMIYFAITSYFYLYILFIICIVYYTLQIILNKIKKNNQYYISHNLKKVISTLTPFIRLKKSLNIITYINIPKKLIYLLYNKLRILFLIISGKRLKNYLFYSILILSILFIIFFSRSNLLFWTNIKGDENAFTIIDRLFLASYSLIFYLYNAFFPFNLSAMHAYPTKSNGLLPAEYYISMIIVILAIILIFKFYKKIKINKQFILGFGFFLINISMVLHIIPIEGRLVVGDRYTYLPYIGIFYLFGYYYYLIKESNVIKLKKFKPYLLPLLIIVILTYSITSFSRTKVWKNSEIFWLDVIKKDSTNYYAYYSLGITMQNSFNFESAIKYYDKSIMYNPNFASSFNNRGNAKNKLSDFEGALKDYDKAIEIDSTFSLAYNSRAWTKYNLGDSVGALKDYNKAIKLSPDFSYAFSNIGMIKTNKNDIKGALSDFDNAIKLNPTNSLAYNNRGFVKLDKLKDYNGAIADFNKAIDLSPGLAKAYHNRGLANYNLQNINSALTDYNKAIELEPNVYNYFFSRGEVKLNFLKDFAGAIDDFSKVIQLNNQYTEAYNNRGIAKKNLRNYNGAIEDYNYALSINPKFTDCYNNRANVKFMLNNFREAILDYTKAIELNPNNSKFYINRGLAKLNLKNTNEACYDFREALKLGDNQAQEFLNRYCR